MNVYKSFAFTVIGGSHIKHGIECQDACAHETNTDMSIAVVADGHGDDNCFRSAKGSKLAAACATRGIKSFIDYLNEPEEKPKLWQKAKPRKDELSKEEVEKVLKERLIRDGIIRAWYRLIAEDFTNNPVTEDELKNVGEKYLKQYQEGQNFHHIYGATLIAAAITKDFWFGFHIGDGRLTALYPDGSFDQPVPWDNKCNLNVTTSICDEDADKDARSYFSFHAAKRPPAAVFLCTDGIDDNYPVEGNEKHLFKLYRTIAITFAEDGFESTCKQLKDLTNSFATKGKGDDTSIALLINMEAVKKTVPVWKKQIEEEEKDTVKKAAREEPQIITEKETDKPEISAAQKAIAAYQKQMNLFGKFIKSSSNP
ncbi:MAG: protein phosphatase 2C domain-containing protein [Treponema sp.]|nr:protein phosphatase 2C domain-containing protein [Treponema sp.]